MEDESGPNWLDLPSDITSNILERLSTTEILMSASQVCPQWWNICKDPLMWRTIRIPNYRKSPYPYAYNNNVDLRKIYRSVVKRSCGHLEYIDIETNCTNDILKYIADNGNHLRLRCMRLVNCWKITDEGFIEVVRKLPQLEKVDISRCYQLSYVSLQDLGRSCPLLKSLKFVKSSFADFNSEKIAFAIAETMPGLRYLDMKGHKLTQHAVLAIIDKCPLLQSLDIRDSHYLNDDLKKRCIDQINDLQLPVRYNHEDNYDDDDDDDDDDGDDFHY